MKTWFHNQNIIWLSRGNWAGIAKELTKESTAFLCNRNFGLMSILYTNRKMGFMDKTQLFFYVGFQ